MTRPTDETARAAEPSPVAAGDADMARRALLKKIGRYAAVTPPAVTLLMSAGSKRALAASLPVESSRQFKNSEGPVDSAAVMGIGEGAGLNAIDGVGICLAAIKALNARLDMVEGELRPALL